MNITILTGNLTRDIETRFTPKGTAVGDCAIAVQKGWGEQKKTNFFNLTFWGKNAENAAKYLAKGSRVIVTGELDLDEWNDKQTGQKRTAVKIHVREWEFAGEKSRGNSEQRGDREALPENSGDDDIPF